MIKPTPAPWVSQQCLDGTFRVVAVNEHALRTICDVYSKRDEVAANAQLLSAAPELLAALELCVDALVSAAPQYGGTIRKAMAALAKAKGIW